MTRKPPEIHWQPSGCCSWCGHPFHPEGCNRPIRVATGPSWGKTTPTAFVPCPCRYVDNSDIIRP